MDTSATTIRLMTERELQGKVAIVTGGGSGIGRATVRLLAEDGAEVVVVDRDEAGAKQAAADADAAGSRGIAVVADLADATTIRPLVDGVIAEHGHIDILVNSAGISAAPHNILDFTDATFEQVFAINVRAIALLLRDVGRHMIERGIEGRIVSVSSSAAFRARTAPALYAASKAAVNGLTRAAAADLGPHGINVNAVAPGLTKTAMTAAIGDDEAYARLVQPGASMENLLGRAAEPEDVAYVIRFLCLPASRQMTGQVVHTSAGHVV